MMIGVLVMFDRSGRSDLLRSHVVWRKIIIKIKEGAE
jgi:hypothetical protein